MSQMVLSTPTTQEQDRAYRVPLTGFQPDSLQILEFLETARANYQQSPRIRERTVRLLEGLTDNDLRGQVDRVASFVRRSVIYVRDPQGGEYVISPIRMLDQIDLNGFTAGDCDDHVMLLNTMLGSIGFETRFTGVKINKSDRYNHVISMIKLGNDWMQLDPCVKSGKPYFYTDTLLL